MSARKPERVDMLVAKRLEGHCMGVDDVSVTLHEEVQPVRSHVTLALRLRIAVVVEVA